jgi:type IV pilus assembly protein PilO
MPDLLSDITQAALAAGIETEAFLPGAEAIKDFYAEKPIQLKMLGTYHQFGAFISNVASMPRVVILTMHDVALKPLGKAVGADATVEANAPLMLEGTVKTYRYLDEAETEMQRKTAAANRKPPVRGGE